MNIKQKLDSSKKFVVKHKVGIAVTGTSAFWIYVNRRSFAQYNDFLKEKGLYEEFWTPEEEA